MNFKQLEPGLAVGPQITPGDMPDLAKAGFKAIIVNRPDGEEPGQPDHESIARAAKALGIVTRYIPAFPGRMGPDEAEAFARALDTLPGPVFAYCRSGARSTMLATMAEQLRHRRPAGA